MHIFFKNITSTMLDFVFPPQCFLCKCGGHVLCTTCLAALQPPLIPRCQHCHTILTAKGTCRQCWSHPLGLGGLRTFGTYREPLRTCIHALKYEGRRQLAEPLGRLLAEAYTSYNLLADVVLPVPLHATRLQERGYNQSALLASVCAKLSGLTYHDDLLIRQRPTLPQVGLSLPERSQNVTGAFQPTRTFTTATEAFAKRRILIIDDVCTTGSTIEACANALFAAGARSIWGLVLARPDTG
jgi:ComF family protein